MATVTTPQFLSSRFLASTFLCLDTYAKKAIVHIQSRLIAANINMYANKELPAHSALYMPIMAVLVISWLVIGFLLWTRLRKSQRKRADLALYGSLIEEHRAAVQQAYDRVEEPQQQPAKMPYLTDEQVKLAATVLDDFEQEYGYAPTAERLLAELANSDKEIKRIVKKADEEVLKEELIFKLKQKGVETDD